MKRLTIEKRSRIGVCILLIVCVYTCVSSVYGDERFFANLVVRETIDRLYDDLDLSESQRLYASELYEKYRTELRMYLLPLEEEEQSLKLKLALECVPELAEEYDLEQIPWERRRLIEQWRVRVAKGDLPSSVKCLTYMRGMTDWMLEKWKRLHSKENFTRNQLLTGIQEILSENQGLLWGLSLERLQVNTFELRHGSRSSGDVVAVRVDLLGLMAEASAEGGELSAYERCSRQLGYIAGEQEVLQDVNEFCEIMSYWRPRYFSAVKQTKWAFNVLSRDALRKQSSDLDSALRAMKRSKEIRWELQNIRKKWVDEIASFLNRRVGPEAERAWRRRTDRMLCRNLVENDVGELLLQHLLETDQILSEPGSDIERIVDKYRDDQNLVLRDLVEFEFQEEERRIREHDGSNASTDKRRDSLYARRNQLRYEFASLLLANVKVERRADLQKWFEKLCTKNQWIDKLKPVSLRR